MLVLKMMKHQDVHWARFENNRIGRSKLFAELYINNFILFYPVKRFESCFHGRLKCVENRILGR